MESSLSVWSERREPCPENGLENGIGCLPPDLPMGCGNYCVPDARINGMARKCVNLRPGTGSGRLEMLAAVSEVPR